MFMIQDKASTLSIVYINIFKIQLKWFFLCLGQNHVIIEGPCYVSYQCMCRPQYDSHFSRCSAEKMNVIHLYISLRTRIGLKQNLSSLIN